MLACGGTWVARGSGDADRLTVDADDRVRVPHREERVRRMRRMREVVAENNVYRRAGKIVSTLLRIDLDESHGMASLTPSALPIKNGASDGQTLAVTRGA